MNVKLHDVISSLVSDSGIRVIEAILGGESEIQSGSWLCAISGFRTRNPRQGPATPGELAKGFGEEM